jgi:hypothetical protein
MISRPWSKASLSGVESWDQEGGDADVMVVEQGRGDGLCRPDPGAPVALAIAVQSPSMSVGRESFSTTVAHYAKPEAITGARQRKGADRARWRRSRLLTLKHLDSFETFGPPIVSNGHSRK